MVHIGTNWSRTRNRHNFSTFLSQGYDNVGRRKSLQGDLSMNKKDSGRPKWPKRFGFIYGAVLIFFTAYVLLDTFVIPKEISAVAETSAAAETSVQASTDTSAQAKVTDTSYDDGNISISCTRERLHDTDCYIVDIQLSDISYLKTAFANNTYGRNLKETTSDMAKDHDAILAINGDYYGFRDYGYVIRNGTLYRDTGGNGEDLVIDSDGNMRIIDEDETSASELVKEGVLQVFSFGPALVNNGEITVGTNEEVEQAMNSNPRTAIGMISPLHYIIVVSDGRSGDNEGLTLYQLAQIFEEKGAAVAYNLDGGGSTTLYFNGTVINNPTGSGAGSRSGERKVSDIIYFGETT